ncbi:MAG: pimeloyl-ACP methyl ester carboxylesterase [Lentimonas sp.]|jgi:pimeloyl-ACP methyl ester carboxylesterase
MAKPTILTFSGWAQNPSSLDHLLSAYSSHQIINFNYSQFSNVDQCFKALENSEINPEIIIGWSLGGQIAARLISQKIFNPTRLILIATPFEFVKSPKIPAAMPKASFDKFRNNFANNSAKTLEKFSLLMMLGSQKRAQELEKNLHFNPDNYQNLLFWLDELGKFSCFNLNFNNFPETLIIHGQGDVVVNYLQAQFFAQKIPHSNLKILANCGHCPHISNITQTEDLILNFQK